MDSIEDFQLKHGSLFGGARKGCICLSLRISVFLQGLINIIGSILLAYTIFLLPFEQLGIAGDSQVQQLESSKPTEFSKLLFYLMKLLKYIPPNYSLAIKTLVLGIRGSIFERNFTLVTISLIIFSSLLSIFGSTGKSRGQIKLSIFSFIASQIMCIIAVFYAPLFGRSHGLGFLSNHFVLLISLSCIIFFTMWYSHLLYSLYKVFRAGGTGGEYLSYREIIDRRNFLRWKTWKERELERGPSYNKSFSRSSEKDRLIKSSR
ncbi:membrane protein [Cryptosporidium xiaoi]|uniref:Membrane protein n=1 Tax=Cryptosporidium xiaoi TaxID=659607 RepID=A0AAV9Y2C7_9CRYT